MDDDIQRRLAGLVAARNHNDAESRDFLRRLLRANTLALNLQEMT